MIGARVTIGEGTTIGPHCVIEGRTTIGRDNRIFQFCSLGAVPQDKKYAGEDTALEIGDRNTIREFCTFNLGTAQDAGATRIGSDNWIMAYVHIAHDCQVGDQTILANNATLAGHVHLGDWAFIGGLTGIHQFVQDRRPRDGRVRERGHAGRAALHDGRRQPARGARVQRRGAAPARLRSDAHRCGQADAPPAVSLGPDVRGRPGGDRGARRRRRPKLPATSR